MQCERPHYKGVCVTGRFEIPYRVYGRGEDIVCLNGAQQSMAMWFSFLQRFQQKYRITLFDFPNQGKSVIRDGSWLVSLEEQIEIIRAVFESVGIGAATVASASWGGVTALLFALHYPQFVKRLILASIGMRANEHMRETIVHGVNMRNGDRREMARVLIDSFGSGLTERIKCQIRAQFEDMSTERLRAFCEHGLSIVLADSLDKVVPLDKIRKNTILLYGENDRIIDFKDVLTMASCMPDCAVRIVPRTGHFLHLENEKVFDVYEELLSGNTVLC